MAIEESAGIKTGDMVACYVPHYAMPGGIDLGVVLNQYIMNGGIYYKVEWLHGGRLTESERILLRNRKLYEKIMRENLYVEPIR